MTDQELIVDTLAVAAFWQKEGLEQLGKGDIESATESFSMAGLFIARLGMALTKED